MASPLPIHVSAQVTAPMAKVMAASWKAGIFPVATVMTARSDHIRIAVSPISVAVREDIGPSLRAKRSNPAIYHIKLDCFVAYAPRNDVMIWSHHILPAVDR